MRKTIRFILATAAALMLTACAGLGSGDSSYKQGLDANVRQYELFSDTQLAQQQTLQNCYQFNPNKSECSILTAATNAQQTLAGQPAPLRVAKSPGEIAESIVREGLERTMQIFGIDAILSAVKANAQAFRDAAATSAQAQADMAKLGIEAAVKPPLVVDKPVIVQVPAGSGVLSAE